MDKKFFIVEFIVQFLRMIGFSFLTLVIISIPFRVMLSEETVDIFIVVFSLVFALVGSYRYMDIMIDVDDINEDSLVNILNENNWIIKEALSDEYIIKLPITDRVICSKFEIFIGEDRLIIYGSRYYAEKLTNQLKVIKG